MTSLAALQKCECLLNLRMRPSTIKYDQDLAAPYNLKNMDVC